MRQILRSILFAAIAFAGIAAEGAAQSNWERLESPYGGSVFFIPAAKDSIYVFGDGYGPSVSTDNGATWHRPIEERGEIYPMLANSKGMLFFAGDDPGGVFRSDDGGKTWTRKANGILDVQPGFMAEAPDGTIWMTSFGGAVYRTTDDGETWSFGGLYDTQVRFPAVSPEGNVFIFGERGSIFRHESDTTWVERGSEFGNAGGTAILFRPNDMLVGTERGIFRSTDNGDSFSPFALPGHKIGAFSLHAAASGELYALSDSGLYRISADGSSAVKIATPPGALQSFWLSKAGDLLLGYSKRGIHRSTDDGITWNRVGVAGADAIQTLVKGSDGALYAAMSRYGLHRSTDRGTSWTDLNIPEEPNFSGINDMTVKDGWLIIAAGDQGRAFRTTDNGSTWTRMTLPDEFVTDFAGVLALPSGAILLSSNDGIARSTDDGVTWTTVVADKNVGKISVASNGDLWSAGNYWLGHSTDDGMTWEDVSVPNEVGYRTDEVIPVGNGVLVATETFDPDPLIRSTDGGRTWTNIDMGCEQSDATLTNDAAGNLYLVTECDIRISTDGGVTWSADRSLPEGEIFGNLLVVSSSEYYFDGRALHRGTVALAVREENEASASLAARLFPNPASDRATLCLNLEAPGTIAVALHDALGRQLASMERSGFAGENTLELDLPRMIGATPASGLYMLRVKAGGGEQVLPVTVVR